MHLYRLRRIFSERMNSWLIDLIRELLDFDDILLKLKLILLHLFVEDTFDFREMLLHGLIILWKLKSAVRAFPFEVFWYISSYKSQFVQLDSLEGAFEARDGMTFWGNASEPLLHFRRIVLLAANLT